MKTIKWLSNQPAGSPQQQHWLQQGVPKTGHMLVVDPGLQQPQHTAAPETETHHTEHLHLGLTYKQTKTMQHFYLETQCGQM
jgi:hypothetical protein